MGTVHSEFVLERHDAHSKRKLTRHPRESKNDAKEVPNASKKDLSLKVHFLDNVLFLFFHSFLLLFIYVPFFLHYSL